MTHVCPITVLSIIFNMDAPIRTDPDTKYLIKLLHNAELLRFFFPLMFCYLFEHSYIYTRAYTTSIGVAVSVRVENSAPVSVLIHDTDIIIDDP